MSIRIKKEVFYYPGTFYAEDGDWLRNENGKITTFKSIERAEECIKKLNSYTYILSHGEYQRPNYTIVEIQK